MAAILNFGSRPTSGNGDSVISESVTADNMGVEVGIAVQSLTVQKLFLLSV
jgi:hypothetical protein